MSSSTATSPAERVAETRSRTVTARATDRLRVLAPGIYAWLLTVVHPVAQPGVPFLARAFACAALAGLVAGLAVEGSRPVLGRRTGIYGFVGFSLATWSLVGPPIAAGNLDPLRSALGVLGWVLFAFGWGSSRGARVPEDAPNVVAGAPLAPRARISRAGAPVVAFAIVTALALEALAFRVDRQEQALFAHAAATGAALLVLGGGARLALGLGGRRELASAASRLNSTAPPLAALAVLLGLGLVWAAFTR